MKAEPKLLEVLRELQPLILLGSFSLVVATFAAPLSNPASGYAVGASMGFLTAFTLLFFARVTKVVLKDFDPEYFILSAYVFIGVGLVLLYFVPGELAKVIPSVQIYSGYANALGILILAVWMTDLLVSLAKRRRQQHPEFRWSTPLLAITGTGLWIFLGYVGVVNFVPALNGSLTGVMILLLGAVLFIGGVFAQGIYGNRMLKTSVK